MKYKVGEKNMSNKFTIVKCNTDSGEKNNEIQKLIKINNAWQRQYTNAVKEAYDSTNNSLYDIPQEKLMKIGFAGIKLICSLQDSDRMCKKLGDKSTESLEECQKKFEFIDVILSVLGCLTIKNFVTTFPITKEYDGEKWQSKDYFFTMDVLSNMDWDKPIGRDKMTDLLWDYQNNDLRETYVEYMCVTSALYRAQTGKGIAEQWVEDMGIPTYEVDDDSGFIMDNQTGKVSKLEKSSHIQIVK